MAPSLAVNPTVKPPQDTSLVATYCVLSRPDAVPLFGRALDLDILGSGGVLHGGLVRGAAGANDDAADGEAKVEEEDDPGGDEQGEAAGDANVEVGELRVAVGAGAGGLGDGPADEEPQPREGAGHDGGDAEDGGAGLEAGGEGRGADDDDGDEGNEEEDGGEDGEGEAGVHAALEGVARVLGAVAVGTGLLPSEVEADAVGRAELPLRGANADHQEAGEQHREAEEREDIKHDYVCKVCAVRVFACVSVRAIDG